MSAAPYAERDGGDWYVVTGDHSDRLGEGFASRAQAEALIAWLQGGRLPKSWSLRPSGSGELSWEVDCAGRRATMWARAVRREFPARAGDVPLDAAKVFPTWEDLAERGLIAITDNGGETADRHSAWFRDGDVLAYNDIPTHPQGFSQWAGEGYGADRVLKMLTEPGTTETLVWPRLESPDGSYRLSAPEMLADVTGHALERINQGYADAMTEMIGKGMTPQQARDQLVADCMTYAALEDF